MKEAGALTLVGNATQKVGTSLAEKVTRIPGTGGAVNQAGMGRTLNKTRVGAAVAGAALAGAGIAAIASHKDKNQEKQAAVGLLIQTGIDYDTAVNLVSKKASQLYS